MGTKSVMRYGLLLTLVAALLMSGLSFLGGHVAAASWEEQSELRVFAEADSVNPAVGEPVTLRAVTTDVPAGGSSSTSYGEIHYSWELESSEGRWATYWALPSWTLPSFSYAGTYTGSGAETQTFSAAVDYGEGFPAASSPIKVSRGEAGPTAIPAQQTPVSTSIVYVVDDSGSMDGDFREVRAELEEVRNSTMTGTKVALIGFGTSTKILFELTEHSDAPWDAHIGSFGGKLGGTFNPAALQSAKALLDADNADAKKIVFFTDAQASYPADEMEAIRASGIVVDTVAFGDQFSDHFTVLQRIADETGGSYRAVPKPSQGTINDPAVTPRAMSAILPESVASNTATLFLVDTSYSMRGTAVSPISQEMEIASALSTAWAAAAAENVTDAHIGMAGFLGETILSESRLFAQFVPEYKVHASIGGPEPDTVALLYLGVTGSTDIDNALREAYTTVSVASAENKRVVLVSDGISSVEVQDSTLSQYSDNGVILDAVAWGAHADRVALKSWADATSGRFNVVE